MIAVVSTGCCILLKLFFQCYSALLRITTGWQLHSLRSLRPNPGQGNSNGMVVKRTDACNQRELLKPTSSLDFANPSPVIRNAHYGAKI